MHRVVRAVGTCAPAHRIANLQGSALEGADIENFGGSASGKRCGRALIGGDETRDGVQSLAPRVKCVITPSTLE